MPPTLCYDWMDSPLGKFSMASTEQGLCYLSLTGGQDRLEQLGEKMGHVLLSEPNRFHEVIEQLTDYMEGTLRAFDLALDLSQGTRFQQQVWEAAQSIPYGQVRTYAELARSIGRPKAARAVGSALGRNPLLIVVPCHRVLRSDGGLGGFAAGLEVKRALLRLEGHASY
jgi:methylated-DNA-[protein]-cysteine S-methyltransferase